MVIGQAVTASQEGSGPSSEGLVVQAGARCGPVQVFFGQGFPPILVVIHHPLFPFVVPFRPNDSGLIGQQLLGLFWEPGCQDCGHDGVSLQPLGDVGGRGT